MRIEDLLEFEGLTADQMRRLRYLWAAGRNEGEIEQELGLSGALVTWAIWVRHLPLDRAVEVVSDMTANVVSPFGRNGWEYLRERGLTPEGVR